MKSTKGEAPPKSMRQTACAASLHEKCIPYPQQRKNCLCSLSNRQNEVQAPYPKFQNGLDAERKNISAQSEKYIYCNGCPKAKIAIYINKTGNFNNCNPTGGASRSVFRFSGTQHPFIAKEAIEDLHKPGGLKMRKKAWIAIAAAAVLSLSALCFTACGGGDDDDDNGGSTYNYSIRVWVGTGTGTATQQMINDFNDAGTDVNFGFHFNATVEELSESVAAGNAISSPSDCADIFCIAQDQLARVVNSNLTAAPNTTTLESLKSMNSEAAIKAATIGSTVQAYPLTYDNGYFMYYDTRVVPESDAGSLEKIIADVQDYNTKNTENVYISMNLADGGSWYGASFFYGTGCQSEWTTNDNGQFINVSDDIQSSNDKAIDAIKGMMELYNCGYYQDSASVSDLSAATRSAVLIDGVWDYNAAKTALGENLGIAALPTFTVGENTYTLTPYLGYKFLCVKPTDDSIKTIGLQKLALYLTGETCQAERLSSFGWGPTNTNAANNASSNAALNVLYTQTSTPQGQYPTSWWATMDTLLGSAKDNASEYASQTASDSTAYDSTIKTWLDTYHGKLSGYLNKDDSELEEEAQEA